MTVAELKAKQPLIDAYEFSRDCRYLVFADDSVATNDIQEIFGGLGITCLVVFGDKSKLTIYELGE